QPVPRPRKRIAEIGDLEDHHACDEDHPGGVTAQSLRPRHHLDTSGGSGHDASILMTASRSTQPSTRPSSSTTLIGEGSSSRAGRIISIVSEAATLRPFVSGTGPVATVPAVTTFCFGTSFVNSRT